MTKHETFQDVKKLMSMFKKRDEESFAWHCNLFSDYIEVPKLYLGGTGSTIINIYLQKSYDSNQPSSQIPPLVLHKWFFSKIKNKPPILAVNQYKKKIIKIEKRWLKGSAKWLQFLKYIKKNRWYQLLSKIKHGPLVGVLTICSK